MNEDMVELLIHRYMPLVYKLARRMCPQSPRDEDLLQCGVIGLWRAAEVWDQKRPFGPLARRYVIGEMADHMRRMNKGPRAVSLESVEEAREDDFTGVELAADVSRLYPEKSRQRALTLAVLDGRDLSEAARGVGLRPARARKTLRRVARNLTDFREPE